MKQTLALQMAMFVVLPCVCLGATLPVTNGLALWLKADAGVTTDAKQNVTAWLDQSAAKNNLTIVCAPALQSGAVHRLPAVVFQNGAYAKLDKSVLALSWIGVYKFGTNNMSDRGTAMLGAWDQWAGFGGYHAYMPVDLNTYVDGILTDKATPLMTDAFHLNDWRATLDDGRGARLMNAIAASFPGHGNGTTCDGVLAEVAVFDRKVSVAEMNKLRAYFAEKYGCTLPPPVITLTPGRRQAISGFGAGMLMDGPDQNFNALSPDRVATVVKVLWGEGKLNTIRLWAFFDNQRPPDGKPNLEGFETAYINNGLIRELKKNGVTHLLLSPAFPPAWCVNPANGQLETDQQAVDYAELIASFIGELHTRHGVDITITGVANECPAITFHEWPVIIKNLRAKLDARGLKRVKITAPEWANNDGYMGNIVNAILNDPEASAALFAISSHSYAIPVGFGAYEGWCQGQGREFWEDESGTSDSQSQSAQGAEMAGHVISDVNYGVANWVFFIGAHATHSEDGLRILLLEPYAGKNWLIIPQRYYYFRQISEAFNAGAVMRLTTSSLGENAFFGRFNPRLVATGGRNADGTWAVAVLNCSGGAFDGGDARKAETYAVDVVIPELANVPSLTMTVHRSGPGDNNDARQTDITMKNGNATITIASTELVTLRATTAVNEVVDPPVIKLPGGTYVDNPPVAITCATSGAKLHYTLDGSVPTPQSPVYTGPITLPSNATTTVRVMAAKSGLTDSGGASTHYNTGTLLFADTFSGTSVNPAWYFELGFWRVSDGILQQYNTLPSATKWAALRDSGITFPNDILLIAKIRVDSWGADGPSTCAGIGLGTDRWGSGYNLLFYKDKQTIQLSDVNKDQWVWGPALTNRWNIGTWYWLKMQNLGGVLTAKVWSDGSAEPKDWMLTWKRDSGHIGYPSLTGGSASNVTASFASVSVTAAGTIGTAAMPTFTPPPGTYNSSQSVKLLTATPGIGVRYTLDGSEPTATSSEIWPDNALVIGTGSTVLKARARCPGLHDSPVATGIYTIRKTVNIPIFALLEGNYTRAETIAIATPTKEATIHYTTDGSVPTEKSPVYAGPIKIKTSTNFKAKAFAPGMNYSLVASAVYELVQFGATLFSDSFDTAPLGKDWSIIHGDGSWVVQDGMLHATNGVGVWDTNKAIADHSGVKFPTNLSITARVRVDRWVVNPQSARAGVALGTVAGDGKGVSLIFNHDTATVAMLDDGVAWGPKAKCSWKAGTWYRFRLVSYNGKLHGRVWPDGSPEPDHWLLNWEHAGRVGFPALYGGFCDGEAVSFDDVKVETVIPMK